MKIKALLAGVCAAALLLSACQASPEDSLVVHKNMENLISEAQSESTGKTDAEAIRAEVPEGERYQTVIENESLGVRVSVDAEVEVPRADTLNIYRVKQKRFTQDFVDLAASTLMGEAQLYDGDMLYRATKKDIEDIIAYYQGCIEEVKADFGKDIPLDQITLEPKYTEEEWREVIEREIAGLQSEIDRYRPIYESAPAEVTLTDYPVDTAMKIKTEQDVDFFNDGYSVEAGSEYASLMTAEDAPMRWLFVENTPTRGSVLRFTRFFAPGVYPSGFHLGGETELRWYRKESPASLGLPDDAALTLIEKEGLPQSILPVAGDEVTISEEEARAEAEKLLDALGIEAFAFDEGRVASVIDEIKENTVESGEMHYRRYWVLKYRRTFGGVVSSAASGIKESDSYEGETYTLSTWEPECIEIHVNDGGIAGFQWDAPIEVTETVVENASLKPFSEIRNTFEAMICVVNARNTYTPYDRTSIQIDRVRLTYARVSEPDNFDTGLMVPVWSFEGVKEDGSSTGEFESVFEGGTLLAINAIDGSVIDSALGY